MSECLHVYQFILFTVVNSGKLKRHSEIRENVQKL